MRTFNGLQIFTELLTNSGQLDLRYVGITGANTITGPKTFQNLFVIQPFGVPTGSIAPGISGQVCWDSNSLYICTSGNGVGNGLWKMTVIGSF